jgi:hypothetical protein
LKAKLNIKPKSPAKEEAKSTESEEAINQEVIIEIENQVQKK